MTKILAPITVVLALVIIWYVGAYVLNAPQANLANSNASVLVS
jgi:hypothetical protein